MMDILESRFLAAASNTSRNSTQNGDGHLPPAVDTTFLLLGFVVFFSLFASFGTLVRSRASASYGRSKRRKVMIPPPEDVPHPALQVKFESKFHPKYYRNERNSMQCFPRCKEWGEYSLGRLAGKEHKLYTRGECADVVEFSVVLPKHMVQSVVFLGRITASNVEPDIHQNWECSSPYIQSMLEKGYSVGVLTDVCSENANLACVRVVFAPTTQWKFSGRIGKQSVLYFEVFCLRDTSGHALHKLNLPWTKSGAVASQIALKKLGKFSEQTCTKPPPQCDNSDCSSISIDIYDDEGSFDEANLSNVLLKNDLNIPQVQAFGSGSPQLFEVDPNVFADTSAVDFTDKCDSASCGRLEEGAFHLEKLNFDTPQLHLDIDVPQPNLDIDVPESNLDIDVPQPNLDIDVPESNLDIDVPQPNLDIDVPQPNLDVDILLSNLDVDKYPCNEFDDELMDDDTLAMLAGDSELLNGGNSQRSNDVETGISRKFSSDSLSQSSGTISESGTIENESALTYSPHLDHYSDDCSLSSCSRMSSSEQQFVVIAKYISPTFSCGTTKSLKPAKTKVVDAKPE